MKEILMNGYPQMEGNPQAARGYGGYPALEAQRGYGGYPALEAQHGCW
jgi:hypothetical protein